jgi:hypothetical protein
MKQQAEEIRKEKEKLEIEKAELQKLSTKDKVFECQ